MQSKATTHTLGYVGAKPGKRDPLRDSDSWFTPAYVTDKARAALGGRIDFDPFSSRDANKTVKARRFLTLADDALTAPKWATARTDTVWMNPPYGRDCARAVERFTAEFRAGKFRAGVVLVNNATDTRWFRELTDCCAAMLLTHGRIGFENTDGKAVSGNTRGQAILYFGDDAKAFTDAFSDLGSVWAKVWI